MQQNVLNQVQADHCILSSRAIEALNKNNLDEAIALTEQAMMLAPTVLLYRRNLGELLRRNGQLTAAIQTLTIAVTLESDNAENHFLLGLAYNDAQQFQLAIDHYHIALSYQHNDGLTWNNLGAALEKTGNNALAKIAYITAITLNYQHAEAHNNLGALYSIENRHDEARTHFIAAIDANPDFVDAHYNLSLIKTYHGADPHLIWLESIAKNIDRYSVEARIRYYFALGKALDDTKQYARAFTAYFEGNQLQYQLQPWNKKKLQTFVEDIITAFTSISFKKNKNNQNEPCPIFIVGMPRSGTTLIEQILSSHESIYGAGELLCLDDVIQKKRALDNKPLREWLSALTDEDCLKLGEEYVTQVWQLSPDKKYIVDKMPGNCFYVGMIYRMLPNAKIIHTTRDPMDTCFSCFTHLFKENIPFSNDLIALGQYYQLYQKIMQYWRVTLPDNAFFEVQYEQMVEHHEILVKELLAYIGLPWDENCLNFYNNSRIVKTASLMQVRQPIYKTSVKRWKYFEKELVSLSRELAV